MRRAKRPPRQQSAAGRQRAGDGVNLGRGDRLLEREPRQDRRQPLGQHGLSRSRRADHQHVVAAGGGDFQRALGLRLAADVGEVGDLAGLLARRRRLRRSDRLVAAQMPEQRGQMLRADHAHRPHRRRLVRIRRRHHELAHAGVARHGRGDGQRAAHRRDGAVERQLAGEDASGDLLVAQELHGVEDADGDREIESRSLLLHIGG